MIADRLVPVTCALALALALVGCIKTSTKYCATHDDPTHCPGPDGATGHPCTGVADCAALPTTPVCDTQAMTCVGCLTNSDCANPTPTCDVSQSCRACRVHADCSSEVCLVDGTCADLADVAYLEPATGNASNECRINAPCDKISDAITTGRSVIKLTGPLAENVVFNDATVTLVGGSSAALTKGSGSLLAVTGASTVRVQDLRIGGTSASGSLGVELAANTNGSLSMSRVTVINNSVGGIRVTGGRLVLERSRIEDNLGGGLVVRDTASGFTIRNNFLLSNGQGTGGSASLYGGALLELNSPTGKFVYNTVAFNASSGVQNRAGLMCIGAMNRAVGNVIYGNREATGGPTDLTQVGGNCQLGNTFVLASGSLGFVAETAIPPDFHLTDTATMLIDKAGDCTAEVTDDFDGDPRPTTACDLGADEYVP